ncbi:MAG: hypothetical protein ACODAJ_03395 [Planctomycetota bacterium]
MQFGLGVYLGFPLHAAGAVIGTLCALHDQPYDFAAGEPSARARLIKLRDAIEADLEERRGQVSQA